MIRLWYRIIAIKDWTGITAAAIIATVYPMGLANKATYPVAFGIINSVGQIGGACAPLIAGILLDSYSWTSVFIYMGSSAFVCLLILCTIVEPVIEGDKSA